jgi:hypothetical protein
LLDLAQHVELGVAHREVDVASSEECVARRRKTPVC